MATTYNEQFYILNTWNYTPYTTVQPVKMQITDANDDGNLSTNRSGIISNIDKVDGHALSGISVGDTITINSGGQLQTITGVTVIYFDQNTYQTVHAFTPTDGTILPPTAALISASPFQGALSNSVAIGQLNPPCFTPGAMIVTPMGERRVEDLKVGDRVITRDNGIQKIRWVGRKDLKCIDLARDPKLQPILIQRGALGNNLPEHDILVSPNHRVLINSARAELYFEDREVLVAAKHLTDLNGVDKVEANGVSYIHFMFDQHELVLSHGSWTESFQPGDQSVQGLDNGPRDELFAVFPELKSEQGRATYSTVRRSLRKFEAQVLLDRVAS